MTDGKKSKKESKLIIKNDLSSLVGFTAKSVKKGELASIATAGAYLSDGDLDDPFVQSCKNHITRIMSGIIFPKLLYHFSNKLPKEFHLQSVRIELFADEKQNTIYFNKEAKIKAICKNVKGKSFIKGERVTEADMGKILNLYCDERDPNAACLLFTFFGGQWMGVFDYHYNRKYVSEKYRLAQAHLKSALDNYGKGNFEPFYNSLWDGYELLGESILLIHNQLKLKDSHQKISKSLQAFCQTRDLDYGKVFQNLRQIREGARYGPPHPKNMNYKKMALTYLYKTMNFSEYVEGFLKERQVDVNSKSIHTVDKFV